MIYLHIKTDPDQLDFVQNIVKANSPLDEVVSVSTEAATADSPVPQLGVTASSILQPVPWADEQIPCLFTMPLEPNETNLLALIYVFLNNFDEAYAVAEQTPELLEQIDIYNRIMHGIQADGFDEPKGTSYWELHNAAVVKHYGYLSRLVTFEQIAQGYTEALVAAPSAEWRAFTTKHLATFFHDNQLYQQVEKLIREFLVDELSEAAKIELGYLLAQALLQQLTPPYSAEAMQEVKELLWKAVSYYEQHKQSISLGLALKDAGRVATLSESFAEGLGYIQRAEAIFRLEEIPEILAAANFEKGVLLYTWAQQGNPQFYKGAMEAFQEALKVMKKEVVPDTFAEIQHYLGVIYSEIPDEIQKKSLWAAVSVSSFKQALEHFTAQTHPYEYARVCSSYANALTKYPDSVLTDNYEKALHFYRESLLYRQAHELPVERALTILNFLEAAWQVNLADKTENEQQALLTEMKQLAAEVSGLTTDPTLTSTAQEHLNRLTQLP